MSDFDVLGTVGKLALPSFLRFKVRGKPSLGWRNTIPRTEATGVFLVHRRAFFRRRFMHVVDVAPDVGFRRSWCRRKACVTFFLKVWALNRDELGFARYDLANRGHWDVPHTKGSFSGRDSDLTRGALDDLGVARRS